QRASATAAQRTQHRAGDADLLQRHPTGRRRAGMGRGADTDLHRARAHCSCPPHHQPLGRALIMERADPVSDTVDTPTTSETTASEPENIDEAVAVPPTVAHQESQGDPPVVFDVKELGVHYGSFLTVHDVDLEVHKNEVTAFIGPSGCGKTTVL